MSKRPLAKVRQGSPPGFHPPYPPSWPDRLGDWLDRLPGPTWMYYILIGLIVFAGETLVQWQAGTYPVGTFLPFHLFLVGFPAVYLGAMHYLDRVAGSSIAAYRPALRSPDMYRELRYRLTTMPSGPLAWTGIAAIAINLLLVFLPGLSVPFGALQFATTPVSLAFNAFVLLTGWWVAGAITYHTLRQLSLVSRIYTQSTRIDLLSLGPLYSLSRVTATTALGLVVSYFWFLSAPALTTPALKLLAASVLGGLALGTFVIPLWGAHRALLQEKNRRLGETAERLKVLIGKLHRGVDSGNLRGVDRLSNAIAGLEVERGLLEKVPTWPWEPQTVRGLIAALLLPVLVWLVQLVLSRVLGA